MESVEQLQEKLRVDARTASAAIQVIRDKVKLPALAWFIGLLGHTSGLAASWIDEIEDNDKRHLLADMLATRMLLAADVLIKLGNRDTMPEGFLSEVSKTPEV